MTNGGTTESPWQDYLSATIIVGAASTICVILRLLSVARYNVQTTYEILQTQSTTDIIVGTLIALLPAIAIIVACATGLVFILNTKASWVVNALLLTASIFFYLLSIAATPRLFVFFPAYLPVLLFFVYRKKDKINEGWRHARVIALLSALPAALLLIAGLAFASPWLPSQVFQLRDGIFTGYVLSDNGNEQVVLLSKQRIIVDWKSSDILRHSICQHEPWDGFPTIYYLAGLESTYGQCVTSP